MVETVYSIAVALDEHTGGYEYHVLISSMNKFKPMTEQKDTREHILELNGFTAKEAGQYWCEVDIAGKAYTSGRITLELESKYKFYV